MKKRNLLNSPRLLKLQKKRRRVFLNKILFFMFAFFALLAGLTYISRTSIFNIGEIKITGAKTVNAEMVKATALKEIAGNYLWFFPKTNILFYPKNKIEKELRDKFKRLKDINFNLESPKILSISLKERESKYVWCGENLTVGPPNGAGKDSSCSFMDENGYVFDAAPYFSDNLYYKFFGPLSEYYFSPDIFEKTVAFKDVLVNMGIKPVSFYLKSDGDVEIYLSANIFPPDSPRIILKKDFDLEKISKNLQTALSAEPLKSDFKKKYSSLEYIDLRFGNKVYYKFH